METTDNKNDLKLKIVLNLEGGLTIYKAPDLRSRLLKTIEENDLIEVDIQNVVECDCAGVQLLCSAARSAGETGKGIIISGKSQAVEDVLSRTGMTLEMVIHQ